MSSRRLRIAYLCDMSPLDRNLYSGGNARMYDALRTHAGEVEILPQTWGLAEPVRRLILSLPDSANLRLRWRAHYALRAVIARQVEARLAQGGFDVVFGAYSLHSMAGVKVPKGMVSAFCSDAVQTVYRESEIGQRFARQFALGKALDGWVERREAEVLRQMDVLLWPSDWLHQATQKRYGVRQGHVVPWGANIDTVPPPAPLAISRDKPLRLLVIGRDWWAKGGPTAFETMMALRARGVDARLTVIGCVPPEFHVNDFVTVHPQLNKAIPGDLAQFNAALAEAHFLIQPSFESYGFAFCEASAHGLPSLCLRVGGVPVRDGVNGFALPVGATTEDFAQVIESQLANPDGYAALRASARAEYEQRLNWDAWGRRVAQILRAQVATKSGPETRSATETR
ncbi:glycosyltransferase family 4 protein [Tropicibacter naphthalenivorans]|uniref:D-inositol-3-phosphate glycosyltransferase n=1 Tax=Tropicibacter naphthalenivorans TaxID=441103 RepID=A0A0P1GVF3_9RHOB|nr:glycosyltransferase family 4 protein [Tropicibacter naphthalenivorans]CUH79391.1 D-inositol-3-phosphate glycosyltransferase [Tropicibacter naphthalenivorans]SMC71864.1 Glycosyltransferase involved in cell wall bisynthesis [Tropicibacter naphthalenivorans]